MQCIVFSHQTERLFVSMRFTPLFWSGRIEIKSNYTPLQPVGSRSGDGGDTPADGSDSITRFAVCPPAPGMKMSLQPCRNGMFLANKLNPRTVAGGMK